MITIELTNRQKIKRINLKQLRQYLKKVLACLFPAKANPSLRVSFLLCDNRAIKKLNKKYFKSSAATDVIAFPLADSLEPGYLGEIVVSVEKAVSTAKNLCVRWQDELNLYLIHGILHLTGHDDRTKAGRSRMEKEQNRILKIV